MRRAKLPLTRVISPRSKVDFDTSTSGLLCTTSVRGRQRAEPVRHIFADGQRQADKLTAELRRYEFEGTQFRRAGQRLKDWQPQHLPLHYPRRFATICDAHNRTGALQCETNPLKRAIWSLRLKSRRRQDDNDGDCKSFHVAQVGRPSACVGLTGLQSQNRDLSSDSNERVGRRFQSFEINNLEMVDPRRSSWNQIADWLKTVDAVRDSSDVP